jgi:hypothetical protein
MIKVIFTHAGSHFVGLEVSGHAYSGEPGHDLVCAAVSVLSQTLVNAIESVGGIAESNVKLTMKKGYLAFKMHLKDANETTDAVFKTIEVGIEGLVRTYPQYIEHINEEVHTHVKDI